MKPFFILLLAFFVASCGDRTKPQYVEENDATEPVVEPQIDLRKVVERDSTESSALESPDLLAARKKLKSIQIQLEKALVKTQIVEVKGTETQVAYHWLSGALLKIALRENRANSLINKEYYLSDKQPVLVFEMETNIEEMAKDPDYYEPTEDSLFFHENKLIGIKCNLDCGAPFATKYLLEEGMRVKAELDVLLSALE